MGEGRHTSGFNLGKPQRKERGRLKDVPGKNADTLVGQRSGKNKGSGEKTFNNNPTKWKGPMGKPEAGTGMAQALQN